MYYNINSRLLTGKTLVSRAPPPRKRVSNPCASIFCMVVGRDMAAVVDGGHSGDVAFHGCHGGHMSRVGRGCIV